MPVLERSVLRTSSQRFLGRPGGRRPSGRPRKHCFGGESSSMQARCPAQRRRMARRMLVTGERSQRRYTSSLCLTRHACSSGSNTGPNIRRRTLLSNISRREVIRQRPCLPSVCKDRANYGDVDLHLRSATVPS